MSTVTESIRPIELTERVSSLDELRGVAVLGILIMNIAVMGLPLSASFNPSIFGGMEGADLAAWRTAAIFADGSMRAIFTMLFGAGFILFLDRLDARGLGAQAPVLYVRRVMLLIGIGVFDVFVLLWSGDILWVYGIAALALLPFWKASLRTLAIAAVLILAWQIVWMTLIEGRLEVTYAAHVEAVDLESSGAELSDEQLQAKESWPGAARFWYASEDEVSEALKRPERPLLELSLEGIDSILGFSIGRFLRLSLLDSWLGMLVGIIAYRLGLLSGRWSCKNLFALSATCLAVAVPMRFYSTQALIDSEFSVFAFLSMMKFYYVDRFLLALAWIGLIQLLFRLKILSTVRRAMAAVGRLALTNYLLQSLMALVFFVLLGYYGQLSRLELYWVVGLFWTIGIAFSVLWLRFFNMGPIERLWRAGVYRNSE